MPDNQMQIGKVVFGWELSEAERREYLQNLMMQQVNKPGSTSGTTDFLEKLKAEKEVERLRQVLLSVMEGMEHACPEGERDVDKLRGGYFILYSQIKKALYPEAGAA